MMLRLNQATVRRTRQRTQSTASGSHQDQSPEISALSFEETELEHELKTHPKYKRLQNYSSRRVLKERSDRFRGSTLTATATETTYWTTTNNPTIKTGIESTKDTLVRQYVEKKGMARATI
ncbi:MAG: hypothetical protein J07HQW1_02557 [Haloquadratum walsbyi J07HQW1]|uniref:Uncharacterized protein n=1 Tax=Haloquadratum walsbyi J07HQW1 TaxID=1238424 RepID=U1N7Q9_9EURY|nr:MAG: hypothetical protein J07HQW1_02557 [Haloquadratum walsbyi J07HQW1]